VRIRDEVGGLRAGLFGESVTRKVGDWTKTLFWSDPWLGGIRLSGGMCACSNWRRPSRVRWLRCFHPGGGWWGGLGVTETIVGVGGGDVGGVSDFTSQCDCAG
jgi:hypothetical protein